MNERIKELAEQSGLWFVTPREDLMDDFAELIVNKVFELISEERFTMYEPVVYNVKKYFGVEE